MQLYNIVMSDKSGRKVVDRNLTQNQARDRLNEFRRTLSTVDFYPGALMLFGQREGTMISYSGEPQQ